MALEAHRRLGPYQIVAPLGAGGMGEVYRALDPRLGREVAIKILLQQTRSDSRAVERLSREARATAALAHPNVLTVYDIGEEEGITWVASELLEGETLRERLRRGPLDPERAVTLFLQISAGLNAAHSRGIIHRDIKPENLFLTRDGSVKILDFGLARVTEASDAEALTEDRLTATGTILGTAAYMAPEQLRGERADQRSDIFALGCVLYEMLTGSHPYARSSTPALVAAILNESPRLDDATHLTGQQRQVIGRALARNPAERFSSVSDMAGALGAARSDSSEQLTEMLAAPRAWRLAPPGLTGSLAVLVVLLATIGWLLWSRPGAEPDAGPGALVQSLAVLPLADLTPGAADDFFADGVTDALINELAQIASLRVISRTSAMLYRNPDKPLREIARELGVTSIVEATVRRSGQRVIVNARLIDAEHDRNLWAGSFDREVGDTLTLQSVLARTIAEELKARLTPAEATRLERTKRMDPDALELYIRGRQQWNIRTKEGLTKAIEFFERALEIEPGSALVWAGVADAHAMLANNGHVDPGVAFPLARTAAMRALELDPDSSEARATLGLVQSQYDLDWSRGTRELARAVELKPSYATAAAWYGQTLTMQGEAEAGLAQLKRATELDPLSGRVRTLYAQQLFHAGRIEEAVDELNRARDLDPAQAYWILCDVSVHRGQLQEAMESAERCCYSDTGRKMQKAYVLAASGRRSEAHSLLAELERNPAVRERFVVPIAKVHIRLGDLDRAFEVLDRVPGPPYLFYLVLTHPEFAALRSDPRYDEFRRRLRLPV
jgi:eukaryotic-like serine/threonine-protein kinase